MHRTTEDVRPRTSTVRDAVFDAVRFTVVVIVAAAAFMAVAAVWVGTCGESTFDVVACGAPQLTMFRIGAPMILLGGAAVAFGRSYRAWRQGRSGKPWQASGWCLMAAMLVVVAKTLPLIALP